MRLTSSSPISVRLQPTFGLNLSPKTTSVPSRVYFSSAGLQKTGKKTSEDLLKELSDALGVSAMFNSLDVQKHEKMDESACLKKVKKIVEEGRRSNPDFLNSGNGLPLTAMSFGRLFAFAAVKNNHLRVLRYLIKNGLDLTREENSPIRSDLLSSAIAHENQAMIKLLRQHGENPFVPPQMTIAGELDNPVAYDAFKQTSNKFNNNLKIKYILLKEDVKPLIQAAQSGNVTRFQEALKKMRKEIPGEKYIPSEASKDILYLTFLNHLASEGTGGSFMLDAISAEGGKFLKDGKVDKKKVLVDTFKSEQFGLFARMLGKFVMEALPGRVVPALEFAMSGKLPTSSKEPL